MQAYSVGFTCDPVYVVGKAGVHTEFIHRRDGKNSAHEFLAAGAILQDGPISARHDRFPVLDFYA